MPPKTLSMSFAPCAGQLDAALRFANAVYDFVYLDSSARDNVRAVACEAFVAMREEGWSIEESLACAKSLVRGVAMGGSLRVLDDRGVVWLRDHLVKWAIECFYETASK